MSTVPRMSRRWPPGSAVSGTVRITPASFPVLLTGLAQLGPAACAATLLRWLNAVVTKQQMRDARIAAGTIPARPGTVTPDGRETLYRKASPAKPDRSDQRARKGCWPRSLAALHPAQQQPRPLGHHP